MYISISKKVGESICIMLYINSLVTVIHEYFNFAEYELIKCVHIPVVHNYYLRLI